MARGSKMQVSVYDEAGPFFARLERSFPDEFMRAQRHVANRLRTIMKRVMFTGDPPGAAHWDTLSGATRAFRRYHNKKNYRQPGGKLRYMVRYAKRGDGYHVGFLNKGVRQYAWSFQKGERIDATQRMRRYYSSVPYNKRRLKLSNKTIERPARPVVNPVFDAYKDEIPEWIVQRIDKYLKEEGRKTTGKKFSLQADLFMY